MSKLTNDLNYFCYDWEMRKVLKVRLQFRGEAACVAFANLWGFLASGTNTIVLEQKDMELQFLQCMWFIWKPCLFSDPSSSKLSQVYDAAWGVSACHGKIYFLPLKGVNCFVKT